VTNSSSAVAVALLARLVKDSHVPRTVDLGVGNGFNDVPVAVQHDQASGLSRIRHAIVVGKLPTITQPLRRTTSAVVRPTPPGHGPGKVVGSI
jgi:hypothetical protein